MPCITVNHPGSSAPPTFTADGSCDQGIHVVGAYFPPDVDGQGGTTIQATDPWRIDFDLNLAQSCDGFLYIQDEDDVTCASSPPLHIDVPPPPRARPVVTASSAASASQAAGAEGLAGMVFGEKRAKILFAPESSPPGQPLSVLVASIDPTLRLHGMIAATPRPIMGQSHQGQGLFAALWRINFRDAPPPREKPYVLTVLSKNGVEDWIHIKVQ